jgi:tetratricopeptide (TPR) repeat protein
MLPMVAAVDLLGVCASAQTVDPRRRRANAQAAFNAAVRAWREGDYPRALNDFRRAQELSPHPATLFNVARAEERVGHIGAAIEAYEEYLRQAPEATDAGTVRQTIVTLFAAQHPIEIPAAVVPAAVVPVAAVPAAAVPAAVVPVAVVLPASSYERIVDRRRHRLLSFRLGLIGGFAAPRDRQNLAVGLEATVFFGRSLTLLAHGLAIDTDGGPQVFTGELGWTFVGDDFDLAVLVHAGILRHCDSICRGREGPVGSAVFLGGITLKVDVLFHPRFSAGLYGRFSWQELSLLDGAALLSSIGLSVSFHL